MLNDKIIKELENLAKMPNLSHAEISIILFGFEDLLFLNSIQTPGTPEYKAYQTGYLLSKAEFATKLNSLSSQGSSPAQAMTMKLRKETKYNNQLEDYARQEKYTG